MKNKIFILLILCIVLFGFVYFFGKQNRQTQVSLTPTPSVSIIPSASISATTAQTVLGVRTKTLGCQAVNALPDRDCTPGAVFPSVTKDDICVSGYAKSVRNVSTEEKSQVFAQYGIVTHSPGEYEVDHLISLELGGSNDIANLWPEAANPTPGFHEKDKVENYLHDQVCNGTMSLQDAQQQIVSNWLEIYQKLPR